MIQKVNSNIKKKEISDNIQSEFGTSRKNIDKITQDIVDTFIEVLVDEQKINIKNFGVFRLQSKKERTGRNPKTLQSFKIKSRKVVSFKPSNHLKSQINI